MPRIVGGQSPKCKVQTEFTFLWAYLLRRPFSLQRLKVVWGSCCHQRCKQCLTIFNKRRYKYPHKWVVSRVPTLSGLNLLRCAKLYIACMFGRHCFCIFPSMMNGFPGEVWNHYSELTLRQSGAGSGDACLSGGHQPALCAVLSYCTSAQHLSSSSTESWWLLSSHLFLPHYLFTKHKAGQGAVHSFTGTVFICLKLVNTVKCTEPPLCSAAVLCHH